MSHFATLLHDTEVFGAAALFASHKLVNHPSLCAPPEVEAWMKRSRNAPHLPFGGANHGTGRLDSPAQKLCCGPRLGPWDNPSNVKRFAQLGTDIYLRLRDRLTHSNT